MTRWIVAALLAGIAGAQAGEVSMLGKAPMGVLEALARPQVHVITADEGGLIREYVARYSAIKQAGSRIEIRGRCASACTLALTIPKERLCLAGAAVMAFHMPRWDGGKGAPAYDWANFLYGQYPSEVKAWIDNHGGPSKLPLSGYWELVSPEMWGMGFRRCP